MKVAYFTPDDPNDVHSWSGTTYEMGECLRRQGIEVTKLGPLPEPPHALITKLRWQAYRRLLGQNYWPERDPGRARFFADYAAAAIERDAPDADIVFSHCTIPIAYLNCRKPLVFWTDATFAGMIGFYPNARNLCRRTLRNGTLLEQDALDRCRLAIFSSQWAADSALQHYAVDPKKVKVVTLGANHRGLESVAEAEEAIRARPTDRCKLVLIGVEWVRKGADVAIRVAEELNAGGLPTQLKIVGCRPPTPRTLPSFVQLVDFVSKATAEGRAQMRRLVAESHFLILPTEADAASMVSAEANGMAVPCLVSDVGGLGSLILDGVNGQKFALGADPKVYANYIREILARPLRYRELCLSAYEEYRSRLNWDASGRAVHDLLVALLEEIKV